MVAAKRTVCASTIKRRVDVKLSESLLFLHAVSGCDTTSRPHGIGKVGVLKKYAVKLNVMLHELKSFEDRNSCINFIHYLDLTRNSCKNVGPQAGINPATYDYDAAI
jgi:hypothetical protein